MDPDDWAVLKGERRSSDVEAQALTWSSLASSTLSLSAAGTTAIVEETKAASQPATEESQCSLPIDKGYAWVITFSCMVCSVLYMGFLSSYGIIFVEFLLLFQQPVGLMSLVIAIQSASGSVCGFFTQTVVLAVFSERQAVMLGGLCGGVGIIVSHFANSVAFLIVTQGVMLGLSGALIIGPSLVIVNKYFNKRRSLAMAIATVGGSLGSIVMPLLTQWLLSLLGLRGALLVLGAIFLNIMVSGSLLIPFEHYSRRRRQGGNKNSPSGSPDQVPLRATPAENENKEEDPPLQNESNVDRCLENSDPPAAQQQRSSEGEKRMWEKVVDLFDFKLFKVPGFLVVVSSCSIALLPTAVFGMYLPALALDKGVKGQMSALLLTICGVCGIAVRLPFGYLADLNRISRPYLMAFMLIAASTAGLFTPFYNSFDYLVVFSVVYGSCGSTFFSLMPVVVVDFVGLERMTKTFGFLRLCQGICMIAALPLVGHLRDVTGNYHASFSFLSACGFLSAAILLLSPLLTGKKTAEKEIPQREAQEAEPLND